ncbi:hypothetical protein [Roseateles sp.]|uniref:hypothetical protein n=1 Tax=Roseateles sp. TaxID=1971397 RepID=UPI00286C5973|nr:hypothetical protein [Roseateles sp.]
MKKVFSQDGGDGGDKSDEKLPKELRLISPPPHPPRRSRTAIIDVQHRGTLTPRATAASIPFIPSILAQISCSR